MEISFLKSDGMKSVIIFDGDINIQINCNKYFVEELNKNKIPDGSFILLLTDSSDDSINGLEDLKKCYNANEDKKILTAMSRETYDNLKKKISDLRFLDIKFFSPNEWSFNAGNSNIMPFVSEGESIGFKIDNLIYSKNLNNIRDSLLEKVTTIITFEDNLERIKNVTDRKFIKRLIVHNNVPREIFLESQNLRANEIIVAEDNSYIKIENYLRSNLSMKNVGLFLPPNHAQKVFEDKKLILNSEDYTNKTGKIYYVASGEKSYGLIRLLEPKKVNDVGFIELQKYHLTTEEEKNKWWPKKKILCAYPFEVIKEFDSPRKIIQKDNSDYGFFREIDFDNAEELLIKDIKEYDPENQSTDVLKDDFRIANAWYATKMRGEKDFKYTREEIINIAKLIYEELKKRGIKFHPEKMKKYSKELFEIISGEVIENSEDLDLRDPKLLEQMKDIKVIKDFISACGSVVRESNDGKQAHDMDLVVRLGTNHPVECPNCKHNFIHNANEYIQRAIKTRLIKDMKDIHPDLGKNIHMIFGDSEGSHDSFIPLYDLVLKKISPLRKIEMMELNKGPSKYKPVKPKSPAITDLEKVIEKCDDFPYIIDEKVNGFHVIAIKDGDDIKIYTEEGNEITKYFSKFIDKVKSLSKKDFAIDGELIIIEDGKQKGRADLIKFVTGKVPEDDSNVGMKVWDITYFKEDIKSLPLRTRNQYLNKLNFKDKISKVKRKTAYDKSNLKRAINVMSKVDYSEGAVIKQANENYNDANWIKYRKLIEIVGKILKVTKNKSGNYNYLIGLKATKDNIRKEALEEGYVKLGETFNTSKKASKGDNAKVLIEEAWRHEWKNKLDYSIHKPRFVEVTNEKLTTLKELDKIVVSVGSVVKEFADEDIKNFPDRMQESFKKNMDDWNDFVIQAHSIGKSLHYDIRHKVNDHLEGFTLFTEGDWPDVTDLRDVRKNIRFTIKEPQPLSWIKFEGLTEPGGLGAERSEKYGGVFTIIAKGKYKVHKVGDHAIHIEYKSDSGDISDKPNKDAKEKDWPTKDLGDKLIDFDGKYSAHIAHIGDRHIMLFDKLKK